MEDQVKTTAQKHVIAVYGAKEMGKSGSIKMAFRMLQEKYPEKAEILIDGYDIKALLCIHGKMVGVESQGDPHSRQMDSVAEFAERGCAIILVASRTRGMTTKSIGKLKPEYKIDWIWKGDYFDPDHQEETNRQLAEKLVEMVEKYAQEM